MRRRAAFGGVWLAATAVGLVLPLLAAAAPEPQPSTPLPEVVRVRVRSIIHPVAAELLLDALRQADEREAAAVIVELDTPGGLLTSTREMFTAMLGARTPVVVYVAPSGAQAASAGFFLLMASDVAAMAPGTNTGAAHPVDGTGGDIAGAMGEKIEQDAAATIRSLAARHGRNASLAEEAVLRSRSFTAQEALDEKLVELVADDLPSLLAALDGRAVAKRGPGAVLRTRGAQVHEIEMTALQRVRSAIAHPNVAYLLMTLGGLGLYFELSTPGAVLPGVVGAICLILAFYALSVLPVSYAGVALILLAALFFLAEIKVASNGLLTVGGLISLLLGSLMLFKTADPALRVSLSVVLTVVAAAGVVAFFLATLGVRAQRQQVQTGLEGLIHEHGVARSPLAPRGKVFVHGEIWDAVADSAVAAGDAVQVVAAEGLLLRVRPVSPVVPSRAADPEAVR
jgi:membrane-bound serine protease (ClpP class)